MALKALKKTLRQEAKLEVGQTRGGTPQGKGSLSLHEVIPVKDG